MTFSVPFFYSHFFISQLFLHLRMKIVIQKVINCSNAIFVAYKISSTLLIFLQHDHSPSLLTAILCIFMFFYYFKSFYTSN